MKHFFVIANPASGLKDTHATLQQVESFLLKNGLSHEIKLTKRPGHSTKMATKRKNRSDIVFVCVGGDGSVNEIAKAIIYEEAAMAIIPVGSGNGLARHLGIPSHIDDSLNLLLNHEVIQMDSGDINGHPFFVTTGVGIDAEVAHKFAKRKTRGIIGYVKETVKLFPTYTSMSYKITTPQSVEKVKASSITIANSSQFGNNAVIAHRASVIDGKLDLCVIKSYPKFFGPHIGLRLFMNDLHNSRFYTSQKVEQLTIESSDGKDACHAHVDGEPITLKYPLDIRILKASVRILVPKSQML